MARKPPSRLLVPADPGKFSGLQRDPDVWASALLAIGSFGSKVLSLWEHVDFFLSVRQEGFKMILEFWEDAGWWIFGIVGVAWLIDRYFRHKRHAVDPRAPTWGLVVAAALVAFIYGSLIAVRASGGFPGIVMAWGGPLPHPCQASLNTAPLLSFKTDYQVGIVCEVIDPTVDALNDPRIIISNPFEILPTAVLIVATNQPQPFDVHTFVGNTATVYPILIPRSVPVDKISTLGDVLKLGGKIVTPQYWPQ